MVIRIVGDVIRLNGEDVARLLPHLHFGQVYDLEETIDWPAIELKETKKFLEDAELEVTKLENTISDLEDEIDELRAANAALEKEVASLSKKKKTVPA